eukprot:CAMPEP_0174252406 /NCGR_PEP_ID=MMETSP0439-20130205/1887_1 /TAXON_ID=0 /ORGANISM="Stereomyxa ramosa, Strain Chinc5" /LENGTH=479 /DNA_ID=CAMNT_0015332933 /DNA_START=62 /DNA_END=1498 /DNA_ORIENTATION=+
MTDFSKDLLVDHEGFGLYYARADDHLKSMQDMAVFFKKYAALEAKHGASLMKLSKTVNPKLFPKTDKDLGTLLDCWNTLHQQLEKMGKLHEQLSVTIGKEVLTEMDDFIRGSTVTNKKLQKTGAHLTRQTNDTLNSLAAAKGNYYKLHKAADQANAAYNAKKGEPTKQKEIDKLYKKAGEAKEKASNADSNYKKILEKANAHQKKFYNKLMPNLLDEFQKFDENRTKFFKKTMQTHMAMMDKFPPMYSSICETLNKSVDAIDDKHDVSEFIKTNQGVTPPPPIEYEPYDGDTKLNSTTTVRPATKSGKSKGSISKGDSSGVVQSVQTTKVKQSWGLDEKDEGLSTAEKIAKLEAEIEEITDVIKSEVKSKTGLDNLVKFYVTDPQAQKKAVQEAEEQQAKVDWLKEEKKKMEGQLEEVQGEGGEGERFVGEEGVEEYGEEEYTEAKAKALFDYEAANESELSFAAGDILTITEQDTSGW